MQQYSSHVTRQETYEKREIKGCWRNHCCHEKSISIMHYKCVFLALPNIQTACALLHSHMWPVWLCHIYSHYLINGTIIGKRVTAHKMCVLIFSTNLFLYISNSKENSATCYEYTNILMQSTHYSCQILMKFEFSRQTFEKHSNIKFHEYLFSGSWVVPCGQKDRQTRRSQYFLSAILRTRLKMTPMWPYPCRIKMIQM